VRECSYVMGQGEYSGVFLCFSVSSFFGRGGSDGLGVGVDLSSFVFFNEGREMGPSL